MIAPPGSSKTQQVRALLWSYRLVAVSAFPLLVIAHALAATVWTGVHLVMDWGCYRPRCGSRRGIDPQLLADV